MKTKTSYGIALCRYNKENNNSIEILLIKKRYSYQFFSFVMGQYKKNDIDYIKHLFNNMSYSEKIDIISMEYSKMWYKIWLSDPEKCYNIMDLYNETNFTRHPIKKKFSDKINYQNYCQKKKKFEKTFIQNDGGEMLRRLIHESSDSEILWEMPKGGKSFKDETNLECAIREFYEETSIKSDRYKILQNVDPLVDSYVDNNTKYNTIYYLAALDDKHNYLNPCIDYRNFDQIAEVEQIKWVPLAEVKYFNLSKSIHNRLIKLYKIAIKKFKTYNRLEKKSKIYLS